MMKNEYHKILIRFVIILLISVFVVVAAGWLSWQLHSKKTLSIYVLNKTAPYPHGDEQKGFFWLLNYEKYVNDSNSLYSIDKDYYGYLPLDDVKKKFDIKAMKLEEIEEAAGRFDMLYYIDTYGVYNDDTHHIRQRPDANRLYGGLNNNDYLLLKEMKRRKKLILAEFNILAGPTSELYREKTEDLFNINWSGWIGRYFSSLDTLKSKDLPFWIVETYKKQNNQTWPFNKSGIVFVYKNNKIVVLESETHLKIDAPIVKTSVYGQGKFGLPSVIHYPFWFEITYSGEKNTTISEFQLLPTPQGDSVLNQNYIPTAFPAVVEHTRDYLFYYFAGDFADNDINLACSHIKGIAFVGLVFCSGYSKSRDRFFREYYSPLVSTILKCYYLKKSALDAHDTGASLVPISGLVYKD